MDPREFGHLFRGFFGLPRRPPDSGRPRLQDPEEELERRDFRDGNSFHFQVFTDPVEIHRFFEQQMDDMMRNFGQIVLGGFGGLPDWERGAREGIPEDRSSRFEEIPGDEPIGRDFMLRHDEPLRYTERIDIDLDDKDLSADELGTVLRDEKSSHEPPERMPMDRSSGLFGGLFGQPGMFPGPSGVPQIRTFSQSKRTMKRPDGSIETEEKVRNSDGSETVVVRRTIGDQVHERRTTVSGSDEGPTVSETFTNMQEADLPDFNKRWHGDRPRAQLGNDAEQLMGPPGDRLYPSLFSRFFRN